MEISDFPISGLKLIKPKVIEDSRGFFKEFYQQNRYQSEGAPLFVQDNYSFSKKGVLRGMHFQSFPGQAKLVSAIQGKIFDVAVDVRKNSPTFGKWQGIILDSTKHEQFFIPEGFAHGFYVLSEHGALVHYKVSSFYNSETEKTFHFNDPFVGIDWPEKNPILSERDKNAPFLSEVSAL